MDEHVNICRKWDIVIIISIAICFCYINIPNEKENNIRILQTIFDNYEFIKNISSTKYEGEWDTYNNENKFFQQDEGTISLLIEKNMTKANSIEISNLKLHVMASDGMYLDRRMFFNISFDFPNDLNLTDNFIQFKQNNLSMDYVFYDYFDLETEGKCFNISLDLKFTKKEKVFIKDFQSMSDILYSKLEGRIFDEDCGFRIYLETESEDDTVIFFNLG